MQFMYKTYFNYLVLVGITAGLLIYILAYLNITTPENEIYIRYFLIFFFILNTSILITIDAKRNTIIESKINNIDFLKFILLSILLLSTIFMMKIGTYASVIFSVFILLFYFKEKTPIHINYIYYSLILYALLMIFGTIGTNKGFRIPDKSLTLLFIPFAFTIYGTTYKNLLKISYVFFKIMLLYLVICVIYWYFNFQYLDNRFIDWISGKSIINMPMMTDWNEQTRLANGTHYGGYYFVTSWAYYFHPSYISLVLFFGLIIGFYLYTKKELTQTISKRELSLYAFLSFLVIVLMQSRIGMVLFCGIITTTSLFILHLKNKNWKLIALVYVLLFVLSFTLFKDLFNHLIVDKVRLHYITLAINYIQENFWWGIGFDQQSLAFAQQEQLMNGTASGSVIYYTHNQFIGNMVQFGVWGLLVLLLVLFSIFRYAYTSRSYLLQQFSLLILLFMLIEEPLYGQKGFTIFTIFLAFFVKISELEKENS